jgi:hypothetical protein
MLAIHFDRKPCVICTEHPLTIIDDPLAIFGPNYAIALKISHRTFHLQGISAWYMCDNSSTFIEVP